MTNRRGHHRFDGVMQSSTRKRNHDMDHRKLIAGLFLGSALVVGCEEQADNTPSRGTGGTTTRSPSTPGTTRDTSTGINQNAQARAQTLIDQVNQHIKNKDYQAAETALRELETMRSDLPQNLQTQITTLRSSLNVAKQGSMQPPSPSTPPSSNPPTEPGGG
jgi:TolA-binding protein